MNYTQNLEIGMVYFLKDYTAPKVFNGLYFECLVTVQKISAHSKIHKEIKMLNEWEVSKIYLPKRFNLN